MKTIIYKLNLKYYEKETFNSAYHVFSIFSCNNDDSDAVNNTNFSNLTKSIKYSPSEGDYTSGMAGSQKRVQYFENNIVIADTTCDAAGNAEIVYAHSFDNNVHTIEIKNGNFEIEGKKINTYDSAGRLIEKKSILYNSGMPTNPISIETFTYNSDGSIVRNAIDPDTNTVMPQYQIISYTNTAGLIYSIPYTGGAESTINYQNDKPVYFQYYNGETWFPQLSFTYYEIPVPANQLKTANQIKNAILLGREEEIANNFNYHLKSYVGHATYNKTFDENGNVLYYQASGSIFEEMQDSETFYYYE